MAARMISVAKRVRRHWWGVALAGLVLSWPTVTRACTPWSEKVLAWDLAKDLLVVGFWTELDVPPPPSRPPAGFELRRLSTGEVLGAHECAFSPQTPCQFEAGLAKLIPAGASWRRAAGAARPPARLRITHSKGRDLREVSLESRVRGRWQRVWWLQVMGGKDPEQRQYSWALLDRRDKEAVLGFFVRARGGNCSYSLARMLRIPAADLDAPGRAGRQRELLARPPRLDERHEYWRTIAELGPIPPERLLEALEAAERDEQYAEGAGWWKQTTMSLTPQQLKPLSQAVARSEYLHWTRPLIRTEAEKEKATKVEVRR